MFISLFHLKEALFFLTYEDTLKTKAVKAGFTILIGTGG
jgi:hypothetical protein